jgi:hypothetical protein
LFHPQANAHYVVQSTLAAHCVHPQFVFSVNPDIFWTAPRTNVNFVRLTCLDARSVSVLPTVSAVKEASMPMEIHARDVIQLTVVFNVLAQLSVFSVIMDTI